ncbi:hypothetical protein FA592_05875 [Sulfurospirillum diekertiae]|uniref:Uncharacterized protein n=1 Tax=Sulfurospirillum diekertiae TaxID=1854492 RepID=A0A6G9VSD7_9BACT|nr:hypothetical protein [Sulfurospirillum diekertiae]QIR75782.1 hypothetical protein FA584_05975 [Sulfurospirillum diekertiae]QIR78427.1 hypothetical protein FA592_05875 [Sulfurospirillum diekertiae]
MNLPHLPPIRFVKEVFTCNDKHATVLCEFPCLPTLPMLIEAAAQASSAFAKSDTLQNGFLVLIKDVSLHVKVQSLTCVIIIEARTSLGNSSEFYFEVFEKEGGMMSASGSLMVVLEEGSV